ATLTAPSTAPGNGDTVAIGGTTYTFVQSLTSTPDQILLDSSSAANSLANLAAAISGGAGAGTAYSSVAAGGNPSVTAVLNAGTGTISLTAANTGSGGNTISTTASWGAFAVGDLSGGGP